MRTLRLGLRGPDVLRWQLFLTLTADGIFGPKTRGGTIEFQEEHKLEPDGLVGPQTLAAAGQGGLTQVQRLKDSEITADIIAHAKRILKANFHQPFGTEVPFESAGRPLVARIEEHFHPPGGPRRPWGPHTGVSVFLVESVVVPEPADVEPEDDKDEDSGLDLMPGNLENPRFQLSQRSLARLEGLHADLVKLVKRAIQISPLDFTVLEGVRSMERQRQLVARGSSRTLKSRHLTGHAVDLAPLDGSEVSWDWPLYDRLEVVVKAAAEELDIAIEWGGDWTSFKDGPHWQLPWAKYPA